MKKKFILIPMMLFAIVAFLMVFFIFIRGLSHPYCNNDGVFETCKADFETINNLMLHIESDKERQTFVLTFEEDKAADIFNFPVELSEEEAKFMKENKSLVRFSSLNECFEDEASEYAFDDKRGLAEVDEIYRRLSKAYYNGYTVKKEPKYYIKFPKWLLPYSQRINQCFLNIDENGRWDLSTKTHLDTKRTQFTQEEIDMMQGDEQAEGLDLDMLKVKVPPEELKD